MLTALYILLGIYYVFIYMHLMSWDYATKQEFLWDLIPFYRVFRNIKEEWNDLQ